MKREILEIDSVVTEIAQTKNWGTVEPVNKGWSKDRKYYVKDKSGQSFQLRISCISEYDNKLAEFERINTLSKLNFNMSMPVEFGKCNDGKNVYMILTWIDGQDARTLLSTLSETDQYKYGFQAGDILKKVHSVKGNDKTVSWAIHYTRKIEKLTERYKNCPIKIKDERKVLEFIKTNAYYLEGREITLQHGDYHVGNFIITDDGSLGIIDFNRSSYGDPWEEYDRYIFTWSVSIPFAIGQIHGYFDNKVPDQFFRLMSLYNATNIIASIPWAIPFGADDVETMIKNGLCIYECYNAFDLYIPNWYSDKVNY